MTRKPPLHYLSMVRLTEEASEDSGLSRLFCDAKGVRKHYVFLGEVHNMSGHCLLVDLGTGRTIGPFHTDNFEGVPEEAL